jgi:hypothetical protein
MQVKEPNKDFPNNKISASNKDRFMHYIADDDDILRAYGTLGIDHTIELNAIDVNYLIMDIIFIVSLNI